MLAPFAVPLVILFAAGLAADLLGAAVLPVFAADSLVQLVFGFQRPVVFALEPEPLFAVELAVDSICAAFQPVSGVDSLLEQPSAVPLPFEQHQPLAVASFLLEQPEHQEFPPLAPLLLSVCLMLLMPVFVRQPEPEPFAGSP